MKNISRGAVAAVSVGLIAIASLTTVGTMSLWNTSLENGGDTLKAGKLDLEIPADSEPIAFPKDNGVDCGTYTPKTYKGSDIPAIGLGKSLLVAQKFHVTIEGKNNKATPKVVAQPQTTGAGVTLVPNTTAFYGPSSGGSVTPTDLPKVTTITQSGDYYMVNEFKIDSLATGETFKVEKAKLKLEQVRP